MARGGGKGTRDGVKIRLILVAVVFFAAWLALWARAGWVQLVQGPHLADMAKRQHLAAELERGRRGRILDRQGNVLAASTTLQSVYARPLELGSLQSSAPRIAAALNKNPRDVLHQLKRGKSFVWLERQVDDRTSAEVEKLGMKGLYLAPEYGRLYPVAPMAGQLVGFANIDGKGIEGLELSLDEVLAGRNAQFVVQRDASGRRLYLDAEGREVDVDGRDVKLTIDMQIQAAAEQALSETVTNYKARWGVCMVVDVKSGDILAMAHYPYFNPNIPSQTPAEVHRNRAVLDVVEPGSTLKPLLVAAALQEGVVKLQDKFFCEHGRWKLHGITIRDDKHEYGDLVLEDVVSLSSNIGSAKIGLKLGAKTFHAYLRKLGFGSRAGLGFPGESKGLMREAERWTEIDLAATSFGQSVGVTAVQLAQAYLVLAADGVKRPLRLVLEPAEPAPDEERVFSPEVARNVRSMLVKAVDQGTGTTARIPGMKVGGKTGTAQKASETGGYGDDYLSSFVGFFPGDEPEYLILAMVDEPQGRHYGSLVAAPVVRETAVKTLAYQGRLPGDAPQLAALAQEAPKTPRTPVSSSLAACAAAVRIPAACAEVPDLKGTSLRTAIEVLARRGLVPKVLGEGSKVVKQHPVPGSKWPKEGSDTVTLWLRPAKES